jgi:transposase-like protein
MDISQRCGRERRPLRFFRRPGTTVAGAGRRLPGGDIANQARQSGIEASAASTWVQRLRNAMKYAAESDDHVRKTVKSLRRTLGL